MHSEFHLICYWLLIVRINLKLRVNFNDISSVPPSNSFKYCLENIVFDVMIIIEEDIFYCKQFIINVVVMEMYILSEMHCLKINGVYALLKMHKSCLQILYRLIVVCCYTFTGNCNCYFDID